MTEERKPKGFVVGLVGPSGSGKSTVGCLMSEWGGVPVVDADTVAHRVMEEDPLCLKKLRAAYGEGIFQDGALDRKALGAIVFCSPEKLKLLGDITYPFIIEACREALDRHFEAGARAAVLDAPTLFESGASWLCSEIVAVVMPRERRIMRIMARDSISREAAEARLRNQFEDSFYTSRAGFVIHNDGDFRHLEDEVEKCRSFLNL